MPWVAFIPFDFEECPQYLILMLISIGDYKYTYKNSDLTKIIISYVYTNKMLFYFIIDKINGLVKS